MLESFFRSSKQLSGDKCGFTLTELIVVITILSILSVIGFVVMSHESSVARDSKRISEIQSLSSASRITAAQLRELPQPIADSLELTVSGTFIGYQGFMSKSLVNPIGYGSDKIYDPLDGTPYTYRVNQHYDQAQFMAYLENPRFERSIEIAKQSLPSVVSKTYALDITNIDFTKRYPYSAGDKLGIFINKENNQPLQSEVITGTGSRNISLSDVNTLDIIIGSEGDNGYVSTDISTGSLSSLQDGSFENDALLAINSSSIESGSSSSGNTSGSGGSQNSSSGSNTSSGYVLTVGQYNIGGTTFYGYIGSGLSGIWGGALTTVAAGDLTPKMIDGKTIDSVIFLGGQQYILLENNSSIPNVIISESIHTSNCLADQLLGNVQLFVCQSASIVGPYTVGELRTLEMVAGGIVPPPPVIPTIPTGLAGISSDSQVQLTWNPVSDATSYTIAWQECSFYGTNCQGYNEITNVTGTGYVHTRLNNGHVYNYKIKAVNANGESQYSSLLMNMFPSTPPETPTNFSATGTIAGAIILHWDAISDGQASFNIEYSTDGTNFTDVGNFSGGGGTRQYSHQGLTAGTTYYYRIRATGSYSLISPWSDIVSATPMRALPGTTTIYNITPGDQSIALEWNVGSDTDSYTLAYSTDENGVYTEISDITNTNYTHTGLSTGTTYYYKIRGNNTGGFGEWSTVVNGAPLDAPTIPTSFTGTAGDSYVGLSWNAVGGASSYTLAYSTDENGVYTEISGINNSNYGQSGLNNYTTYYFKIKAVNIVGESSYSSSISVTPYAIASIPWGLKTTAGDHRITLDWSTAPGAQSYTIAWSTEENGVYTEVPNINSTRYTHTGLTNGNDYFYKIKSVNAMNESNYSSVVLGSPSNIVDIAVGGYHSCALAENGKVTCWGGINGWDNTPPSDLTGVISIDAGENNTCAVKNDGTVVCWGQNGSYMPAGIIPPVGLSDVIQVETGLSTCALKSSGEVVCWGGNEPNHTIIDATQIAVGRMMYGCALKSDSTVECWGYDDGRGYTHPPTGLSGVVKIAAGAQDVCAIKGDGTTVCWGRNYANTGTPPSGLQGIIQELAIGDSNNCALKFDGSVECWGYGLPQPPDGLSSVVDIVGYEQHDLARTSYGEIACWPSNQYTGACAIPVHLQ